MSKSTSPGTRLMIRDCSVSRQMHRLWKISVGVIESFLDVLFLVSGLHGARWCVWTSGKVRASAKVTPRNEQVQILATIPINRAQLQ
jgi:hypothetical protein